MWFVFQGMPGFDETQRWVTNNGLGAVFSIVLLFGLILILKSILGGLTKQIGQAVGYFTTKLDQISARQETALDRLTEAINMGNVAQAQQTEALRTVVVFMSQNIAQLAAHRQAVEGESAPATGVVKPVQSTEE